MSKESPFDLRIYREWESLVFPDQPVPVAEKEERWRRLYQSCRQGEQWSVAIADAGLAASLGITLALQGGRYREAVTLAEQYLAHSDAGGPRDDDWDGMSCRLGIAGILAGDVERGVGVLDEVLENGRFPLRPRCQILRNDLFHACGDLGETTPVPSLVRDFVARLLGKWQEQAHKAELLYDAITYHELREILESTYPPRQSAKGDEAP